MDHCSRSKHNVRDFAGAEGSTFVATRPPGRCWCIPVTDIEDHPPRPAYRPAYRACCLEHAAIVFCCARSSDAGAFLSSPKVPRSRSVFSTAASAVAQRVAQLPWPLRPWPSPHASPVVTDGLHSGLSHRSVCEYTSPDVQPCSRSRRGLPTAGDHVLRKRTRARGRITVERGDACCFDLGLHRLRGISEHRNGSTRSSRIGWTIIPHPRNAWPLSPHNLPSVVDVRSSVSRVPSVGARRSARQP